MTTDTALPLYVRIQRYIRSEIATGRLNEGDRIPTEMELSERFETTRATVARAIQQLVYEGIVVRRAGSGSFVASRPLSSPLQLTQVHSFEDQLAAEGAVIDYELIGFSARQPSDEELDQLCMPQRTQVYELRRVRTVSGKRMSVEIRIIPEELGRRMTVDMLHRQSIHRIMAELGLPIHRVEGMIRARVADDTVADQLEVKKGTALLVRDYTLLSHDRRPLICGESMYRPDFHINYIVQQANI
ncbi:GntR family transcriptional regulator [Halotalea alkalilenta]|uniref:GntR family transcriptional regulator n=1 Tax=Halotalea alkalilenta TaxID=376489 RepID=UPI00138E0119|nr:GntR family transcriptional regulator [Halotalea alkalilenta]